MTEDTSKEKNTQVPRYVNFFQENRSYEQATQIYQQRICDAKEVFTKFSPYFTDRDCPVCGCGLKRELDSFQNSYLVKECGKCLTQYVDPCPSLDALKYYYNECECNALHGDLLRSRRNSKSTILSQRTDYILDLIDDHFRRKKAIKVLEIGCSSGEFLSELRAAAKLRFDDKDMTFLGIDIDRTSISKNTDRGIHIFESSVEDFASSCEEVFDLILHFELIEHLRDPFSFMNNVRGLLSKDGLHHFHTPNANGLDNKALGYNDFRPLAHGIFPPMHLQAFTPSNITHFALRSGFNILQVSTPGNFDVDIVKKFCDETVPPFNHAKQIPDKYLAVFQQWLKLLGSSSHMSVTLSLTV